MQPYKRESGIYVPVYLSFNLNVFKDTTNLKTLVLALSIVTLGIIVARMLVY